MQIKELKYDNLGIARAIVISDSGNEYCTSIDKEDKRSWCSCPSWVFNKEPCKHIMFLLNNIEKDKMINKKSELNFVSSDCKILDDLLGGGVPYGIQTSIFGQPKMGKSMFAYQMVDANTAHTKGKTMFIDTEGLRPQDFKSILYKFSGRFNLKEEDINERCELVTTLGDLRLLSVQKLFMMFGYMLTFDISKNGKYTPRFDVTAPTIPDDKWKDYTMLVIDSITRPIKDSIGANTQNLPARSQLTDRLFSKLSNLAVRHNLAIIVNHHTTVNPVTPFGRDHGKMWGGDGMMYTSKYAIQFTDATTKIKNETGWGEEARRVKLVRRPDEQDTGIWIPIRLQKDYGYSDK